MYKQKNFNLVEAGLIFGIIILLFAMLLPFMCKQKEDARRTVCQANLKTIGLALRFYQMDTGNPQNVSCKTKKEWTELAKAGIIREPSFPGGKKTSSANMDLLRAEDYIEDYKTFICPSSSDKPLTSGALSPKHLSYAYKEGLKELVCDMLGNPDSGIAADNGDPSNHHKFGFILFLDGHVSGFSGACWADNSGHLPDGWSARNLPRVE